MADANKIRQRAQEAWEQGESGVLVEICVECGKEYTFEDEPPPDDLECDKCGGGVFRAYFEPDNMSEARQDFEDSTSRDTNPDDAEGDVTSGDLVDLDHL